MMRTTSLTAVLAIGLAPVVLLAPGAGAATTGITVDQDHLQGWVASARKQSDGSALAPVQRFAKGPGTAPAGQGSLLVALGSADADREESFATGRYDGRRLADLTKADYSTWQQRDDKATQAPAELALDVDSDGDGTFEPATDDDRLVFDPTTDGTVQQGAWQRWTTADGVWRSERTDVPTTLTAFTALHPDALVGDLSVVVDGATSQTPARVAADDVAVAFAANAGPPAADDRFDLEPRIPQISIADASIREGNAQRRMIFLVTLDRAYADDVSVPFEAVSGSATRGVDFRNAAGTATIPAGRTSVGIVVRVVGDMSREGTETMRMKLGTPDYGVLVDGTGRGTIKDNDTAVRFAVANARGTRIRVDLSTLPRQRDNLVTVYATVDSGARRVVLRDLTDRRGELHRVVPRSFRRGALVRVYAVVRTAEGAYSSVRRSLTVR
jgi:hypothetical protein